MILLLFHENPKAVILLYISQKLSNLSGIDLRKNTKAIALLFEEGLFQSMVLLCHENPKVKTLSYKSKLSNLIRLNFCKITKAIA